MKMKIAKIFLTGSTLAALSTVSLAQTASDYEGLWLLTSSNASFSSNKGGIIDTNEGSLKSACSMTKIDDNTVATDCFQGATLLINGSHLNSADGVWSLATTDNANLSGNISIANQANGDQVINVSMTISMKKIAPLNTEIGNLSVTRNGVTQTLPITGFAESVMITSGNAEQSNAVKTLSIMQPNGQLSLVNTMTGVDIINANVGSISVNDVTTSNITINSTDSNVTANFNGHDGEGSGPFTGTLSISL